MGVRVGWFLGGGVLYPFLNLIVQRHNSHSPNRAVLFKSYTKLYEGS